MPPTAEIIEYSYIHLIVKQWGKLIGLGGGGVEPTG